jgi:hypothetical protein
VFGGFNNIHDVLCGEEDVGAAESEGVEGNPADNQG